MTRELAELTRELAENRFFVPSLEFDSSTIDAYNQGQQSLTGDNDPWYNDGDEEEVRISMDNIYVASMEELKRQWGKWGHQVHDLNTWNAIVDEEDGERVKAMNNAVFAHFKGKPVDWDELEKETIETIACLARFYHEVRRMKEGKTDGIYTHQS